MTVSAKKKILINYFPVEDKLLIFSVSSQGIPVKDSALSPLYFVPYYLVSKHVNKERALDGI